MSSIQHSFFMLALLSGPAMAQTQAETLDMDGLRVAFGAPLSEQRLGGLRGGTDTTVNDMRLSGTTAGNSAYNVSTGNNALGSGAFSAMSGIPVVIQNTGANVLIQNAVILNLQLQ
jgi:hypothetical protein